MEFCSVQAALEEIRQGRMIILIDDEDRENEGDLVMASEKVTPEAINFMTKYGRGLVCLTLTEKRVKELHLPLMCTDNSAQFQTAFTVSIDARVGTTTGISAADRATTILASINPATRPQDLLRPGHMFPLKAEKGGVLKRAGQTEGSVDITGLAGLYPSGVICEIMNEDGSMARLADLQKFSEEYNMPILTIQDLIAYRTKNEKFIHKAVETTLDTIYGEFRTIVYENDIDSNQHIALIKGDVAGEEPVLVRVHSACLTGDIFGSKRCDCGEQLHKALQLINEEGRGALIYMHQEGRGIGLINKLKAYNLQNEGVDTVEANIKLGFKDDLRDYGLGAQILVDLGIKHIKLLSNNPRKIIGLEGYGMNIVERVPIEMDPHEINKGYLKTKKDKLGHILHKL